MTDISISNSIFLKSRHLQWNENKRHVKEKKFKDITEFIFYKLV